jgi:preprotein translocase subunit Sec61beta
MAENKIQMPGVFGGLMRYDSEYKSRFMISPVAVIAFVITIVVFVLVLKIFFPVAVQQISSAGGVPGVPNGGVIVPLIKGVFGF